MKNKILILPIILVIMSIVCNIATPGKAYVIDADHESIEVEGVVFIRDMSTLLRFPPHLKMKNYEIPETVTCIGRNAFADSQIEWITFPNIWIYDNNMRIEDGAFSN